MRHRGWNVAVLALVLAACGSSPPVRDEPDIATQPSADLTPPEQALRDRVRALLVERMGDRAKRLRVRVEGTNLWLTGRAPDRWERDRAHDLAHEVPGVTRVDSSAVKVD